jgi:hypothetical protein
LLSLAEAADQREVPDGLDIPLELERRQERLKASTEAKAGRTGTRQRESGQKPRGQDPQPPQLSIQDKDQINLTDEESRILPTSGGGFQQSYNAQAAVDAESLLIVSEHVTNHVNDKQEVPPCLTQLQQLPESLRTVTSLRCDAGYYSDANVENSVAHTITPYIAVGRQAHHPPLAER